MTDRQPVSARVLDEAIAWRLDLHDCEAQDPRRQAFERWHAANPEHARAWAQLDGIDERFAAATQPSARRALLRAGDEVRRRRRRLGGSLGALLCIGVALGGALQQRPLDAWLADQRTERGERRHLQLADRTQVWLNSHSALDVDFAGSKRRLLLREGEILVETGHADPRPFVVVTPDGELRALGTRFLVRREADGTRLTVLQSAVAARPRQGEAEQRIEAGQQVVLHRHALEAPRPAPALADAWHNGMLVVEDMPLGELVARLGEYRPGHLGLDPSLANRRVTGSFPLGDSDKALTALSDSLALRQERLTDWWVTLKPAAEPRQ